MDDKESLSSASIGPFVCALWTRVHIPLLRTQFEIISLFKRVVRAPLLQLHTHIRVTAGAVFISETRKGCFTTSVPGKTIGTWERQKKHPIDTGL